MTIKELREKLKQFPEDKEVRIGIVGIIDNVGYSVSGYAPVEEINYDEYYDKVFIEGEDDL